MYTGTASRDSQAMLDRPRKWAQWVFSLELWEDDSPMQDRPLMLHCRGGPHMRSLISIDFPAPEMEPEKRTCGISCFRSLAPMWRFAMQHHPGNIHQSFATPRYSATPCYVLIQLPNVIDTISKRWRSKKAFNTSPCHIFS